MSKNTVPKEKEEKVPKLCDGCNVRKPHEHRCHGNDCDCEDLYCQVQQGKLSLEEAGKIAVEALKKE